MKGLIIVMAAFAAVSLITLLVYLKQKKPRTRLSFDIISVLVYALVAGFFLTSFLLFFLSYNF